MKDLSACGQVGQSLLAQQRHAYAHRLETLPKLSARRRDAALQGGKRGGVNGGEDGPVLSIRGKPRGRPARGHGKNKEARGAARVTAHGLAVLQ